MKPQRWDVISLTPEEHYDYHKAWSRRQKPHHSEIKQRYYPDILSLEEWLRRWEAVRQTVKKIEKHIKKHWY